MQLTTNMVAVKELLNVIISCHYFAFIYNLFIVSTLELYNVSVTQLKKQANDFVAFS